MQVSACVLVVLLASCDSAQTAIPSEEEFVRIITEEGIKRARSIFREIRERQPEAVLFKESTLDNLAYDLDWDDEEQLSKAIEILKLNEEAYPEVANVHDSLGEAYMILGGKELSIAYFRRAYALQQGKDRGDILAYILENYTKHEYSIPMRDGIRLHTQVYTPNDSTREYPFLLQRQMYSIGNYQKNRYRYRGMLSDEIVRDGYIFVYQDIRGRYKSEGEFVVMRPYIPDKEDIGEVDECSDAYDTIEWLLNNIPNNNGRVGIWGGSYSGWLALMAMLDPHPALAAAMPAAPPTDMWIGDDFHHNGAFRLMYTFDWLAIDGWTREGPTEKPNRRFDYDTTDGYRFFLDLGALAEIDSRYFHGGVPTWNEYIAHGDYDDYWKERSVLQYLKGITVPTMIIAGWFDAEDFYGPLSAYYTIEKNSPDNRTTLIVGPWRHGGWRSGEGDTLGDIKFGENTARFYREEVELPFFRYYLKNEGSPDLPEARVFETGSNRWKSYDRWPPSEAVEGNIYLHADGMVTFSAPVSISGNSFDSFISDPANPVPWSSVEQNRMGHLWMVEDQRFAAKRPDVLVYKSEVLAEDVTIAGPVIADIFVSTTGSDADWIVKLIDVYPDDAPDGMAGYQMLLAGEVFRGKYRKSFEKPEAMVPNQVTEISFDLRDKYHTFLDGHRIMVQVQSSWFPAIDRNPQKFVDIYHARRDDYQKAEHRFFHSAEYPSHIKLRVMPRR